MCCATPTLQGQAWLGSAQGLRWQGQRRQPKGGCPSAGAQQRLSVINVRLYCLKWAGKAPWLFCPFQLSWRACRPTPCEPVVFALHVHPHINRGCRADASCFHPIFSRVRREAAAARLDGCSETRWLQSASSGLCWPARCRAPLGHSLRRLCRRSTSVRRSCSIRCVPRCNWAGWAAARRALACGPCSLAGWAVLAVLGARTCNVLDGRDARHTASVAGVLPSGWLPPPPPARRRRSDLPPLPCRASVQEGQEAGQGAGGGRGAVWLRCQLRALHRARQDAHDAGGGAGRPALRSAAAAHCAASRGVWQSMQLAPLAVLVHSALQELGAPSRACTAVAAGRCRS